MEITNRNCALWRYAIDVGRITPTPKYACQFLDFRRLTFVSGFINDLGGSYLSLLRLCQSSFLIFIKTAFCCSIVERLRQLPHDFSLFSSTLKGKPYPLSIRHTYRSKVLLNQI